MIQSIIYFIIVSLFALAWGLSFFYFFGGRKEERFLNWERIVLSFFTGTAILSVISACISLFLPVQFWLLALLTIPVLVHLAFYRKQLQLCLPFKKLHITERIFLAACLFLFLYLGSGNPAMEDTELYHIQSIKWINEYGTVAGLANLYLRYGFYSNWFHLISIFYLPIKHQNFLYLNTSVCIWMLFFLFQQYKSYSQNTSTLLSRHLCVYYFLLLFYMLFEWDLFRGAGSSTSYDFVVTCYCIISLHLLIKNYIQKQTTVFSEYALLLFLAIVPFFKLTGFLVSFLLVAYLFLAKFKLKRFIFFAVTFTIALIPLVYKNYWQTGYFFYPYEWFSFLHPSWQVPQAMVHQINQYINLSNHYLNQAVPAYAYIDNSGFSYLHNWYLHLTKPDQFIVALSLLSALFSWIIYKKKYPTTYKKVLLLYVVSYLMLIVWFIASPDPRFAFGFFLFTALFPASLVLADFLPRRFFYFSWIAGFAFIIMYLVTTWQTKFQAAYILWPPAAVQPPFQIIAINGFFYHIPKKINNNWNRRCINTPLPCLYQYNPYLQPRGKSYKDGFMMKPLPDSTFVRNYYY